MYLSPNTILEDQIKVQALLDSNNEVNAINLTYTAKLDLKV